MNKFLRIFLIVLTIFTLTLAPVTLADDGDNGNWDWEMVIPPAYTPPVYTPPVSSTGDCSQYVTSSVCGQPAYDTCTPTTINGQLAYNCYPSQAPGRCTGTIMCGGGGAAPVYNPPVVYNPPPVYTNPQVYVSVPPIVSTPGVDDSEVHRTSSGVSGSGIQTNTQTNRQSNVQTQTNNQRQTVTVSIPQAQVVTRTEVVRETPVAIQVATVSCPLGTTKQVQNTSIVCVQDVQIVSLAGVKELPKTGLPLVAWALISFIPAGLKLRKFNQEKIQKSSNYIWEERQFKI